MSGRPCCHGSQRAGVTVKELGIGPKWLTMTNWLHPRSRDVMLTSWRGVEAITAAIAATEQRVAAWAAGRSVAEVVPLGGGTQSVVFSAVVDGAPVVVKAPLFVELVDTERAGMSHFAASGALPQVLDEHDGVFVLERLVGEPVHEGDADAVCAALRALHPTGPARGVTPPAGINTWMSRKAQVFDKSAERTLAVLPHWQPLVDECERFLSSVSLDDIAGWSMLHADVRGKNLLRTETGVRVLDPWTVVGPRAWEIVQSATTVADAGGDATAVLAVAEEWGISRAELMPWLRVGVVHHSWDSRTPTAVESRERLLLLISH